MFQQALAVFLVLGLLLAALWLLQGQRSRSIPWLMHSRSALAKLASRKTSSNRQMQVLERLTLTPQHSLHLIQIENRLLLLAVSPAGCHAVDPATFHALPTRPDVASDVAIGTVAAC